MTPDEYCAARIGSTGSHYGLLFVAPEQRRAANAIFAFVREVNEIADECRDMSVAYTKLDWWNQELERLYGGEARHPVTKALAPVITTHKLERERFFAILDETAKTVAGVRYPNFEFLQVHCQRASAVPLLLVATVFGVTDPATRNGVETLGVGLRMTEILCGLGQDVRRDRLFLPRDDLRRFGVDESDVLACRHGTTFATLMAFEAERALHHFDEAMVQLSMRDRVVRMAGTIMANIARAQLDEIRRDDYRVLDRRLMLTPLRKLWIAWNTRAREWRT
jgi:15-cis-phytoene synthase